MCLSIIQDQEKLNLSQVMFCTGQFQAPGPVFRSDTLTIAIKDALHKIRISHL